MKTIFVDCSPKKKLSASGFIAGFTKVFVGGKKTKMKLRTKGDYTKILEAVKDADNIVFSMPLYVDGIPSHVLPFLREMEDYCKENKLDIRVYVIANSGFIEGKQSEPLMQNMENFCVRSGLSWCGGLGIGGGVMMNVMRILIAVFFLLMLIRIAIATIQNGSLFLLEPMATFGRQLLEVSVFGCGIIAFSIWLAMCINKGKVYGKRYTRIMLPSFVFILVADLFFAVTSLFHGGIFRGWLSPKKPSGGEM